MRKVPLEGQVAAKRHAEGSYMLRTIISAVAGLIELVLVLRFVFRLLGANPANGFVSWIYGVSHPLVTPFVGIFGQPVIPSGVVVRGVFEWASILALIVYGLIASVLLYFLRASKAERV